MENIELYIIIVLIFIIIWLVLNTIKFYKGKKRKVKNLHRFAKEGENEAQQHLAKHYHKGDMVKKDYQKAAFWYQRAAFSGDDESKGFLKKFLNNRKTKRKKSV